MLIAPEATLARLGASRRRPTNPYGFLLCKASDTGVLLYWTLVGDDGSHSLDIRRAA